MTRSGLIACCALLLSLGCSSTDATQIVVAVDTDLMVPTDVDSLHIEVEGPSGMLQTANVDLTMQTDRPFALGLRPASDVLEPVTIRASARLAGAVVVERTVVTGFIKDKSLLVSIWLRASCQGVGCPDGRSCDDGACVSNAVNAASLPAFTGSIPTLGGGDGGGGDACTGGAESCNGVDDDCDGVIDNGFDLTSDRENCGSCGIACGRLTGVASASCMASRCVLTCDTGFGDCDADGSNGCEANLNTDVTNCDSCGSACTFANAANSCAGGSCVLGACDDGFADCDGDARNGCEVDLTDGANCGRCGHDCGGSTCQASMFCVGEEIVAIASGSQHSCGLRANGAVTCWGLGAKGQLGTGATMSSRVPVDVRSISSGTGVSAGGDQSCAVTGSSGLCWGDNLGAQLGDGTRTGRSSPTTVSLGSWIPTQIAMGSAHACAIGAASGGNPGVRCWGTNRNGQVGVGDTMDRTSPVTVNLSGGMRVDPILAAASGRHSCAVVAGGEVYCWGAGTDGQLGRGTRLDQSLPALVEDVGGGGVLNLLTGMGPLSADRVSLGTGNAFTCARDDTGQVYCWGDNSRGQVGDGSSIARRTLPVAVDGLSDAVSLSVGDAHACALRMDGRVSCWGANGSGQLGDNTMVDSNRPVDVMDVPAGVVEVAAGAAHVCLRTMEGHVFCYGRNSVGQLGDGTVDPHGTPQPVSTLP